MRKILIIEDDKFLVKILEEAIDSELFTITLATDATEGFSKAVAEQPDIIVLDVMLPGENGFDCLVRLKNSSKTKKIPVIILSNIGQDEEVKKALVAGAEDYLVKSNFTLDEIVTKIIAISKNFKS